MEPPIFPTPDEQTVKEATRKFYRGFLVVILVVAGGGFVLWKVGGLKDDPAATARCKGSRNEYECRACCDPDLSQFTGRSGVNYSPKAARCGCNIQTH